MGKIIHILIGLSIVFIIFLLVVGSKTVLPAGNKMQVHLIQNQAGDLEIPLQHNFCKSNDDETWIDSNSFELSSSSEKLPAFSFYQNRKTEDFTALIWQPPRFV